MKENKAASDRLVIGNLFFSIGVSGVCHSTGVGCLTFGGIMLAMFFVYYFGKKGSK